MSIQGLVICAGVPCHHAVKYPGMRHWCNDCKAGEPHYPGDLPGYYKRDCDYYKIRPLDHEVAQNVLHLGGSKTYAQMWGHTDDPWPWDDEPV